MIPHNLTGQKKIPQRKTEQVVWDKAWDFKDGSSGIAIVMGFFKFFSHYFLSSLLAMFSSYFNIITIQAYSDFLTVRSTKA